MQQQGLALDMTIHLHLGAHKTATTFLQAQMFDHRAELTELSVGYVPIARLRETFTTRFDLAARVDRFSFGLFRGELRKRLHRLIKPLAERSTIVISDENLAGLLVDNAKAGRLYPAIGARAGLLAGLLDKADVKLFFAIRPQADYLVSAWLQMAARGRNIGFEDYLARFNPDRTSWSMPVAQLVERFGADRVTVWTYDWFRKDPGRALGMLAPGLSIAESGADLNRTVLPSLTAKGLAVLHSLEDKLSRAEYQRMAKLLRGFQFDPPDERIAIRDVDALGRWQEAWARDMSELAAMGITFHRETADAG